jgi:ubiquinone biosynthesis O-methyltransferase
MASEVIEHVRRPQDFMACLAAAAAPGHGQVFITTLNRTPASYALAILGAEHILRIVPAGTHAWTKFLTPQEVAMMGADAGLQLQLLAGAVLQPATGQFVLSADDVSVNYAALLGQVQPEQERQAGVQQVGTARTGALGRAASRYRSQQAQQAAM